MAQAPSMKAKIDFEKVKNIKDIKMILETLNIEFLGANPPEKLAYMLVQVADEKAVINFAKVKKVGDVKLILESLNLVYAAELVPEKMRSMCVIFDANVPVEPQ